MSDSEPNNIVHIGEDVIAGDGTASVSTPTQQRSSDSKLGPFQSIKRCLDLFVIPGDILPDSSAELLVAAARYEAPLADLKECSPPTALLLKRQKEIMLATSLTPTARLLWEHTIAKTYIKVKMQPAGNPKGNCSNTNQLWQRILYRAMKLSLIHI